MKTLLLLTIAILTGCTKETAKQEVINRSSDKIEILDVRRTIYAHGTHDSIWGIWHKLTSPTRYSLYCGAKVSSGPFYETSGPFNQIPTPTDTLYAVLRLGMAGMVYRKDIHLVVYYGDKDSLVAPVFNITNIKYR